MSDLVERVARAIEQSMENARLFPAGNSPYEPEARAAVRLALEEAAQFVQDECHDYDDAHRIAAAIRAMIPSGIIPAQDDTGNAE
jgi:hypothetical protein